MYREIRKSAGGTRGRVARRPDNAGHLIACQAKTNGIRPVWLL